MFRKLNLLLIPVLIILIQSSLITKTADADQASAYTKLQITMQWQALVTDKTYDNMVRLAYLKAQHGNTTNLMLANDHLDNAMDFVDDGDDMFNAAMMYFGMQMYPMCETACDAASDFYDDAFLENVDAEALMNNP